MSGEQLLGPEYDRLMEDAAEYGMEWEATWMYVRGLMRGLPSDEAAWFAICEWDL